VGAWPTPGLVVLGTRTAARWLAAAGSTPKGVGDPPLVVCRPLSRIVTDGGYMAFAVVVSSSSPVSYQWHKDGQPLVDGGPFLGAKGAVLSIEPVQSALQGLYSVALTNQAGGVISAGALLTVSPFRVTAALTNNQRDYVLRVSSQRGDACRIEVSTNFTPYQVVGYVTNTHGTAEFLDRGPFGLGLRSYRAILVRTLPVLVTPTDGPRLPPRMVGYGRRGEVYELEASSDLQQWDPLATISDLSGWVDVTDTSVSGVGRRFYRLRTP
jgi:hypothetical protein